MQANKYYVVWKGYAPGIYDSWEEAEIQISGYPEASYRAFKTLEAATEAYREGFDKESLIKEVAREMNRLEKEGTEVNFEEDKRKTKIVIEAPKYIVDAIAVDAACSGNPGPMEYRGVYVRTGQQLFHVGPLAGGTNNIAEFLAIVHGLALQEKQGTRLPLYSDSVNAQLWVRQGICKTKLQETDENAAVFDLIRRAESWLRTHSFRLPIYKWETKEWGEIPADFGRK